MTAHYVIVASDGTGRIESVGHVPVDVIQHLAGHVPLLRISGQQYAQVRVDPSRWRIKAGDLVAMLPDGPTLEQARAEAARQIDRQAAEERTRHVTAGMSDTYAAKRREAQAWTAGDRDPAQSPMLAAEAAALSIDVGELAATVLSRAAKCDAALAKIEAARQAAKRRIARASSASEISDVRFTPSTGDT